MQRPKTAFTLIELLIVIAVVCILIALLMPCAQVAFAAARQMQCKTNLSNIYKAQQAFQAQRTMDSAAMDATCFAVGTQWQRTLQPFLEDPNAFRCPENTTIWDDRNAGNPAPPGPSGQLEFKVYLRTENSMDPGYHVGDFLWGITIPNDAGWVRVTNQGDHLFLELDDNPNKGIFTYDDMALDLYMDGTNPVKVVKKHVNPSGSHDRYWCDLVMGDTMFVHDWVHAGDGTTYTIALPNPTRSSADYGLSKGIYEAPAGQEINRIDSKLILVLDYPYPLADYNRVGTDDDWQKIFVRDVKTWRQTYKHTDTDLDWMYFNAMRHSGRANVVFCDGHVDDLSYEDLYETSPLWRYTGQ